MTRRSFLFPSVLLVAVVAAVYAPVVDHGFLNYDDPELVRDNPDLRTVTAAGVLRLATEVRHHAWLPVTLLSYVPDAIFLDLHPGRMKVVNALLLAVNGLLVLVLLRRLGLAALPAGLGALAFVLHPALVESTAWISGRKDLLSLLFLLAGLLVFHRSLAGSPRTTLRRSVAGGLFVLGCLAKASVVVFPILALGLHLRNRGRRAAGEGAAASPPGAALLVYGALGIALAAVHLAIGIEQGPVAGDGGSLPARIPGAMSALARYATHVLVPVGLSVHYGPRATVPAQELFAGVAVAALLAAGIVSLVRRPGPAGFGALVVAAGLLPFNGVFPATTVALADRYLAVPLAGAAILAAAALRPLASRWPVAALAFGLLLAPEALLARARVGDFRSGLALFGSAVARDDHAFLPLVKLGEAEREGDGTPAGAAEIRRRFTAAAGSFARALALARTPVERVQAGVKLADTRLALGQYAEALAVYDRVLAGGDAAVLPAAETTLVRANRAQCLTGLGRHEDARDALERLLAARPGDPGLRLLSAGLDLVAGFAEVDAGGDGVAGGRKAVERGLAALEALLAEHPDHPAARAERAKAIVRADWRKNHLLEAQNAVDDLVTRHPAEPAGYILRAQLLAGIDASRADLDLRKAIELDPRSVGPRVLLADLLRSAGKSAEALTVLEAAAAVEPDAELVRRSIADLYASFAVHHRNLGDLDRSRLAAERALSWGRDEPAVLVVAATTFEALALSGAAGPAERDALWRRVRDLLDRARRISPGDPAVRAALAKFLILRGKGIQWEMTAPPASQPEGGTARWKAAMRREAMESFLEALSLSPEDPDVAFIRRELGLYAREISAEAAVRLGASDPEGAAAIVRDALRFQPADPHLHFQLATACEELGEAPKAEAAYREALGHDPAHLPSLRGLFALLVRSGRRAEARPVGETFLAGVDRAPPSEFLALEAAAVRAMLTSAGASESRRDGR